MVAIVRRPRRKKSIKKKSMKSNGNQTSKTGLLPEQTKDSDNGKGTGVAESTSILEMKEVDRAEYDVASAKAQDEDPRYVGTETVNGDATKSDAEVDVSDRKPLLVDGESKEVDDDDEDSSGSSSDMSFDIKQRGRLESLAEVENEVYSSREELEGKANKHVVVEMEEEEDASLKAEDLSRKVVGDSISSAVEAVDGQEKTVIVDYLELDEEELQSHVEERAEEHPEGSPKLDEKSEAGETKSVKSEAKESEAEGEAETEQKEEPGVESEAEALTEDKEEEPEVKHDEVESEHGESTKEHSDDDSSEKPIEEASKQSDQKDGSQTSVVSSKKDDKSLGSAAHDKDEVAPTYVESEDGVITAVFGDPEEFGNPEDSDTESGDDGTTLV